MKITSRQNARVKAAAKLWKRAERERSGQTLIEGYRQCLRALDGGTPLAELYTCPELWLGANEGELVERARQAGAVVLDTTPEVFAKLSMRDRPDGLVAVGQVPKRTLRDLETADETAPLYLVCEGIEKPGNLGAILRSCDGAGVSAVIVCGRVTDLSNPNVIRSSVGTIFTVPVVDTTTTEVLGWLQARDVGILAATPDTATLYTAAPMSGATAIVCGSEQYGLSEEWLEAPGIQKVRIPMRGAADSLNVAQAATLLVYEAVRQRGSSGIKA